MSGQKVFKLVWMISVGYLYFVCCFVQAAVCTPDSCTVLYLTIHLQTFQVAKLSKPDKWSN